jgi:hypothetical protein
MQDAGTKGLAAYEEEPWSKQNMVLPQKLALRAALAVQVICKLEQETPFSRACERFSDPQLLPAFEKLDSTLKRPDAG